MDRSNLLNENRQGYLTLSYESLFLHLYLLACHIFNTHLWYIILICTSYHKWQYNYHNDCDLNNGQYNHSTLITLVQNYEQVFAFAYVIPTAVLAHGLLAFHCL